MDGSNGLGHVRQRWTRPLGADAPAGGRRRGSHAEHHRRPTAMRVALTPAGTRVDLDVPVPPGTTTLRLSTTAPSVLPDAPRDLRVRLRGPTVADAVVDTLL